MLSEQVLELLTRNSPLSSDLIELAWTDISTETKLEIIETYRMRSTHLPEWLVALGLNDKAAIVRYFASRCDSYIYKKLQTTIENDPVELIKGNNTRVNWMDDFEKINTLDFKNKLSAIRNLYTDKFNQFVDWLEKNHNKIKSEELAYIIIEYFEHPKVKQLIQNESSRLDGTSEYLLGKSMKKLWILTNKISNPAVTYIAHYAPTLLGMDKMKLEDFRHLSDEVLEKLVHRRNSKEIAMLREDIINNPSAYNGTVVKSVNRIINDDAESLEFLDEKYEEHLLPSFEKSQSLFKRLTKLNKKLEKIEFEIEVQKNKKGFFF